MFLMEMVKGKEHPPQVSERWSELGKMMRLLMRMLSSYFSTGWYMVLDSGFCMLKALVELKKVGLFTCAVIKKRRYSVLAGIVPGDAFRKSFNELGMGVGELLAIFGKFDGEDHFLLGLREPSCIMKIMSMGGPLLPNKSWGEQKRVWMDDGVETVCQYWFTCPSYNWHYKYPHAVDNHNNLRHALPSIKHTIATNRWEICMFSFLLVVTKVNAYLACWFFCKPNPVPTLQQFCHKLE